MPYQSRLDLLIELIDVERLWEDRDPILIEPLLVCPKIEECS